MYTIYFLSVLVACQETPYLNVKSIALFLCYFLFYENKYIYMYLLFIFCQSSLKKDGKKKLYILSLINTMKFVLQGNRYKLVCVIK